MFMDSRFWIPTIALVLLLAGVLALAMAGCSVREPSQEIATQVGPALQTAVPVPKGGAQVWADNCMRCHNIRPLTSYSNTQWEVVVHHMRVRANLTAQEHRAVVEFLKAGN